MVHEAAHSTEDMTIQGLVPARAINAVVNISNYPVCCLHTLKQMGWGWVNII